MAPTKQLPTTHGLWRYLASWRFWRIVVIGAIAAAILCVSAIQVEQILFRRKVEKLLADVRQLQYGKTAIAEAQQLLRQWPEAAPPDGDCNRKCAVGVLLQNSVVAHRDFLPSHPRLRRLYMALGGHPAMVRTGFEFRDGVLQSGSIGFYVYVTPYRTADSVWVDYTLIGGASFLSESELARWPEPLVNDKLHPTYWVGSTGGCEGCSIINARFLPGVNQTDIDRLLQFDLSCLTRRLHPCRDQSDIMPAAWQQFLGDQTRRH